MSDELTPEQMDDLIVFITDKRREVEAKLAEAEEKLKIITDSVLYAADLLPCLRAKLQDEGLVCSHCILWNALTRIRGEKS